MILFSIQKNRNTIEAFAWAKVRVEAWAVVWAGAGAWSVAWALVRSEARDMI
jgi:hypothetical protein